MGIKAGMNSLTQFWIINYFAEMLHKFDKVTFQKVKSIE